MRKKTLFVPPNYDVHKITNPYLNSVVNKIALPKGIGEVKVKIGLTVITIDTNKISNID